MAPGSQTDAVSGGDARQSGDQSAAATGPAPLPVKPSSDQTAKMAADMLGSALSQRNKIAHSFEAQRAEVLRSVEQLKGQTLTSAGDRAGLSSMAGPTSPPQDVTADALSGNETGTEAPPTPEELAVLHQIMGASRQDEAKTPDVVMKEIVAIIQQLIAAEIARQLTGKLP